MHTFIKESKQGNYSVGRMVIVFSEVKGSISEFEGMFHGLSLPAAIKLTSALNGGDCEKLNTAIFEHVK